jgi:ADP-L-glycero-D-manno-heptose 6-epimerase
MIIVTGAAGLIGSAFLHTLNSHGVKDVLAVDNLSTSEKWKNLVGKSFREYMHKDAFLSALKEGRLAKGIDGIVHMGACSTTTERDVDYLMRNNVQYTQVLAEFAISKGIRFVYASSAATYGGGEHGYNDTIEHLENLRPLNPYGFSKHLVDLWAKRLGLFTQIAGVKFFNVFGPNEYHKGDQKSVVCKAFKTISQTGEFGLFKSHKPEYRDGEQMRDFVYVKDCCDVMWWLLNTPHANGLFNVGFGKARTWNDLLRAVFTAMGKPAQIKYAEMPDGLRNQYQYFTEAPINRLRSAGYSAPFTPLEDAVKDYVQEYLMKGQGCL